MQVRSRQPFIMIIVIITIMIKIIMIMIVIMIIMIVLTLTNDPDDDDESYPDADRCRKRVKGLRECIAETNLQSIMANVIIVIVIIIVILIIVTVIIVIIINGESQHLNLEYNRSSTSRVTAGLLRQTCNTIL